MEAIVISLKGGKMFQKKSNLEVLHTYILFLSIKYNQIVQKNWYIDTVQWHFKMFLRKILNSNALPESGLFEQIRDVKQ